jgi:hypothetical protein
MVHTQGSLSIKTGGFSCFYRPNDEIVFIAVTNIEKIREINFNIVYPLEKNCDSIKNIVNETIVIPPGGTVFHKINLEGELHEQYFNQPINMKWTVDGLRSTFVLCSSKELDQFSIDHVS